MIKNLCLIFLSMVGLGYASTNREPLSLRIATYNVLNPVFEEKYSGKETWHERFPYIIENILDSNSDFLCIEELGYAQYLELAEQPKIKSRFQSFYVSHAPSKPGQKEGKDGIAFFYNPDKAAQVNLVPSADGSRPTHRRDYYVDLELKIDRPEKTRIRIACTHLDSGKDLTVGNDQLSGLVKDSLKESSEIDFVVVCGDFNEGEKEDLRPRYEILQETGFFTDGSFEPTRPEALDVRHPGHVDWIYFKNLSSKKLELKPIAPIGDERASDHKLTMTDVVLE